MMTKSLSMNRYMSLFFIIVLAILCHLVIFMQAPLLWQTGAVLLLTGLLPGILLVEWLVGQGESAPTPAEHLLYSSGAGIAIMVTVMLFVSYLPGPIVRWQTFAAFDFVLLLGLLLCGYRKLFSSQNDSLAAVSSEDKISAPRSLTSRSWLLAGLLSLAVIGGFFRFVNLDYSEFQGDEARAALRAAAVIQGEEDILFIHKKGPTEILLPTVIYSMTGVLNEEMGRLPFAFANWMGLFAVFLLGWRLFGPVVGWTAGMLLALDGYLIGFSRIIQYQSVVFLISILAVLILHRFLLWPTEKEYRVNQVIRYLILAAFLLAISALSHYDAVWVMIPVIYLFLLYAWQYLSLLQAVLVILPAIVVGSTLLASFYVPFILHPNFSATLIYLLDRRLGVGEDSSYPYNNLADFFTRTTLYSTTYYVVLMILLTMIVLFAAYKRGLGRIGQLFGGIILLALFLSLFNPRLFIFNGTDWIVLLHTVALMGVWFMPRLEYQERMLWLWFGIAWLIALFFTAKPRTHVYVFFMPWALLAGLAIKWAVEWLKARLGQQKAVITAVAMTAFMSSIFGIYAYWYFIHNQTEILRTWYENRPTGFWVVYEEPDNMAIFGFPLANGWKVVGSLYEEGVLSGYYLTNETDSWGPDWYTRGQLRSPIDAEWFFEIQNLEPMSPQMLVMLENLPNEGFKKWGEVEINGAPRMIIHKRSDELIEPRTILLDEWGAIFDQNASPYFPLHYPTTTVPNPIHVNFDYHILLEGYELQYEKPLNPGDTFVLTFYWRAQQPIAESYKIFNHVYFGDSGMQAQLDSYPGNGNHLTNRWKTGQIVVDQHVIEVKSDATPGLYPIYSGMYLSETGERLPVFDEAGNQIGSQIQLTDIRIGEE